MIPHLKLTYKSAAAILDISWCFENCHWLAIVLWYVLRLLVIGPICNTKKLPLILRKPLFKTNTFKPPVSGHPKFEDLVVSYGWSHTRINLEMVSSEEWSRRLYFLNENFLHVIS